MKPCADTDGGVSRAVGLSAVMVFSRCAECTMRFESSAQVLEECKLTYYRISECDHASNFC